MSLGTEDKDWIRVELRNSLDRVVDTMITEMGVRFGEVNGRLDRIDATLVNHAKQLGAGTRAIAGLTEWTSKADADYTRVLAELADLKSRISKLEGPK
jgi:hypothetical protein